MLAMPFGSSLEYHKEFVRSSMCLRYSLQLNNQKVRINMYDRWNL